VLIVSDSTATVEVGVFVELGGYGDSHCLCALSGQVATTSQRLHLKQEP